MRIADLEGKIAALNAERVEPVADLDSGPAEARISELRAELRRLALVSRGIYIGADATPAEVTIAELEAKLTALSEKITEPVIDANDYAAQETIASLEDRLARLRLEARGVYIGADASAAEMRIAELRAQIDALQEKITIDADTAPAKERIADLRAELQRLRLEQAGITVSANASPAEMTIAQLEAQIDEVRQKIANPTVNANTDPAKEKIAELRMELRRLELSKRGIPVGVDATEADMQIAELQAKIEAVKSEASSPTNFNLSGLQGGSGLAAGLMGVSGLMPGLSGAAAGMGLLGATAGLAFGNIGAAVMAHSQSVKQAAANQVQYADQVASAEMSLTETIRNAAMAQAQAIESVTMAQQQQQMATAGLAEAQYNLQEAWIQARYALQQLQDQYNNLSTTMAAAELAVREAKYQQMITDQNAMSTSLDRAQAAIAVKQAEEQLIATRQRATYVTAQYNLQEKRGVRGSQQVVTAQTALKQAIFAVQDARWASMMAQKELVNTELNNAAQVKQAQMAVAMAQLQATGGMNQFYADMARLSGPGKEIVRVLLAMHPAIRALEHIAQNAIAPGIVAFLDGVKRLMPEIDTGVRLMGHAMGQAFGNFGRLMSTRSFRDGLLGLIRNGVRFADTVLPAFAQFLQMLGKAGAARGAVAGLSGLLVGLARGLTGLVQGLLPSLPAINQIFIAMGNILAQMGPALGQIVGLIARSLLPLTRYLNQHPNGGIVKVLGEIVAGMIAFKGLQKIVISPFSKLLEFAMKVPGGIRTMVSKTGELFGKLGSGISKVGGFLARMWGPAMSAVSNFVSSFGAKIAEATTATIGWIAEHTAATATFIAENIAQAASATAAFIAENAATLGIAALIAGLIAVVVLLATHWKTVWGFIKRISLDVWHNVLDPMWHGIEAGVRWLVQNVIVPQFDILKTAFQGVEDAALWLWHNVLDPVWQGIMAGVHGFVQTFQLAWDGLKQVFGTPVNFLIQTVYDNGIRRLWDDVVSAVGLNSMKLPMISPVGLASGGVLPGYKPGHDTVPAMLSPGEGVLNPNAVKAIGPGTVHALNKKYPAANSNANTGFVKHTSKFARREGERHTRRGALHTVGLAHGGVIGDIGSWFTSIGSGILHSAHFLASMATDPVGAIEHLLDGVIKTPATGTLGRVMEAIPRTIVADLAQYVGLGAGKKGPGGAGGVSAPVAPSGTLAAWFSKAVKLTGVPRSWIPDLETIAWYESSDRPNAINNWDSNAKAGDPSRGLMQVIMTTFDAYHQAGTSTDIFDPVANIAAAINYIRARYGNPGLTPGIIALAHGQKYAGYDSGGWAMPGVTGIVNQTGKPEAVLTPQQSQAFLSIVERLQMGGGAGMGGEPQVVQNYYGTQHPTAEQNAIMMRDLAMAVSGVAP